MTTYNDLTIVGSIHEWNNQKHIKGYLVKLVLSRQPFGIVWVKQCAEYSFLELDGVSLYTVVKYVNKKERIFRWEEHEYCIKEGIECSCARNSEKTWKKLFIIFHVKSAFIIFYSIALVVSAMVHHCVWIQRRVIIWEINPKNTEPVFHMISFMFSKAFDFFLPDDNYKSRRVCIVLTTP